MDTPWPAGIVGYGSYVPSWRVEIECIARHWGRDRAHRPAALRMKSIPAWDEDTCTMSVEAATAALDSARLRAEEVGGIWIGTESKPYAVKSSAVTVAGILGIGPDIAAGDVEFACKAGTETLRLALWGVGAGGCRYAIAIGMDTAQARPGDELEYTAAAGGGAIVVGPREQSVAVVHHWVAYVSDTPDFYRRAGDRYPTHAGRFTGAPAYFHHTRQAAQKLLRETRLSPADIDHVAFHHPNPAFPREIGAELGFTPQQLRAGLLPGQIGNAYAGSMFLSLNSILDVAEPGERIMCASYGSGAGSDAFLLTATEKLHDARGRTKSVRQYLDRYQVVHDYADYLRQIDEASE